jgi:hypothetical protein
MILLQVRIIGLGEGLFSLLFLGVFFLLLSLLSVKTKSAPFFLPEYYLTLLSAVFVGSIVLLLIIFLCLYFSPKKTRAELAQLVILQQTAVHSLTTPSETAGNRPVLSWQGCRNLHCCILRAHRHDRWTRCPRDTDYLRSPIGPVVYHTYEKKSHHPFRLLASSEVSNFKLFDALPSSDDVKTPILPSRVAHIFSSRLPLAIK